MLTDMDVRKGNKLSSFQVNILKNKRVIKLLEPLYQDSAKKAYAKIPNGCSMHNKAFFNP